VASAILDLHEVYTVESEIPRPKRLEWIIQAYEETLKERSELEMFGSYNDEWFGKVAKPESLVRAEKIQEINNSLKELDLKFADDDHTNLILYSKTGLSMYYLAKDIALKALHLQRYNDESLMPDVIRRRENVQAAYIRNYMAEYKCSEEEAKEQLKKEVMNMKDAFKMTTGIEVSLQGPAKGK
jgi:hypothetical protein